MELEIAALEAEIKHLAKGDMLDGHPWYKNEKYLYLVRHDTQQKEYIGTDPRKQKAALARLERFAEWKIKKGKLSTLQSRNNETQNYVRRAWRIITGNTI